MLALFPELFSNFFKKMNFAGRGGTLPLMPSEAGRWDCSIQPGGKSWAEVADHTRAAGLGRGSQL